MWAKYLSALKKYSLPVIVGFSLGLFLTFGYGELKLTPSTSPLFHSQAVDWFLNFVHSGQQGVSPKTVKANSGTNEIGLGSDAQPGENPDEDTGAYVDFPDVEVDAGKGFTILLVGVDNRTSERNISNTDTLILANYTPDSKRLALLSVPRDTQINYPGFGKQKINAVARLGKGLKSTVNVMENLLGQKIDGYLKVNFGGFKEIIDTLGGITLTVEKDMYYNTGEKVDGIINLKKGTQRLNGTQALQYARFRHDNLADISRTMRQQAVIKAMVKEGLQAKILTKLPRLIPQAYRAVETNLSLGQLFAFFNLVRSGDGIEMVSQTLPGSFVIEDKISYWKIRSNETRAVVRSLFKEGKTQSIFSGQADEKAWGSWLEEGDAVLPVMSPDIFGSAP